MDYEAIRAGLAKAVPLNTYLGLEIVEVAADRGVVRLPDDPRLQNHVASQHAGGAIRGGRRGIGRGDGWRSG